MTSVYTLPSSLQDRTNEFHSCVASISKLNRSNVAASRASMKTREKPIGEKPGTHRSEFQIRASEVARDIQKTTERLSQLALLAKRKPLFDDKPVEISELTFIIKQDILRIKQNLSDIQASSKSGQNGWNAKAHSQVGEHSKNVVNLLQGKLTDVTENFQGVLEVRTKNLEASKNRTQQFLSTASGVHTKRGVPQMSDKSPLYNVNNGAVSSAPNLLGRTTSPGLSNNPYASGTTQSSRSSTPYDDPADQDFLSLPDQSQQLLLMEEQQTTYQQERSMAVEVIESTMQELGSVFQQLATMVAEQREVVQRIDANIEDTSLNVSGAQRELLKYFATVSSNRWLFAKIFGILFVFFFFWVLVS